MSKPHHKQCPLAYGPAHMECRCERHEQEDARQLVRGHGYACRCPLCRMIPFVPNEQEY